MIGCDDLNGSSSINTLNLTWIKLGSVEVRGSIVEYICMPLARASGGRAERKSLVARERREKGLNLVFTSVMNRVIMVVGGLEYTVVCC